MSSEKVTTSAEVSSLFEALAKAQGEMTDPKKDSTNPAFGRGSKYASLAEVRQVSRAALAANKLAVIQMPVTASGNTVSLVTRVGHASGQWIQFELSMPLAKSDAQSIGSATTYARRYAYSAALGLAPDEDDDGNAASGTSVPQKAGASPPPAKAAPAAKPTPKTEAKPEAKPVETKQASLPKTDPGVQEHVAAGLKLVAAAQSLADLEKILPQLKNMPPEARTQISPEYTKRKGELTAQ